MSERDIRGKKVQGEELSEVGNGGLQGRKGVKKKKSFSIVLTRISIYITAFDSRIRM